MSYYENYDRASAGYSGVRQPVGLEILIGIWTYHLGDLASSTLADLGCGSGIYSGPLARYFNQVHGVDKSEGQLTEAQARITGASLTNVALHEGDIRELTMLGDEQIDAVLVSLVLHHLERLPSDRTGHVKVFQEIARVLRPGGVAIVGVCSQPQVYDGAWYCRLMPRASEILAARHPDIDETTAIAQSAHLISCGRFVSLDEILQGPGYFDPRGPLRQEWRDADSIFSLLSPAELDDLKERIRAMDRAGSLDDYVRTHDEVRRGIGQVTFLAFKRQPKPGGDTSA